MVDSRPVLQGTVDSFESGWTSYLHSRTSLPRVLYFGGLASPGTVERLGLACGSLAPVYLFYLVLFFKIFLANHCICARENVWHARVRSMGYGWRV